ncbi:MAG: LamG-like jellyroll fold domain-containing protein [Patescibacteria group bacterium]
MKISYLLLALIFVSSILFAQSPVSGFNYPNQTMSSGWNYYEGRSFYYNQNHLGSDIDLLEGTAVEAIASGKIVYYGPAVGYGELVAATESVLPEVLMFVNSYGELVEATKLLIIYGHLRSSQERGGAALSYSYGDVVNPGDVLGYINDDAHNGDGAEHLHLAFRLSDEQTAKSNDGSAWLRGYENGSGMGSDFTDPMPWVLGLAQYGDFPPWHTSSYSKQSKPISNLFAYLTGNLGLPNDNGGGYFVHDWSGITLQDFYGDNTGFYDGHTAIMLNSAGTEAFLLKEGFRDFYMNLSDKTGGQYFGPTDLGAPTSDEEFNELDGNTYQYFDHGYMKYVPSYYSNTPGVVEVWLGSTKIASNTALMTIAGIGGSGGSGNGTGAVSIYQWTIPSSGVENIPYDFTVKLKNLESESVTYESIRLRAYGPTIASWEWNNVTVAGDAFYEQTVNHTFADSGNYTFKVFVTKDGQSWQIGAIAPEVQERLFPVLAGNPNTTYNPDLLEVTAVSIVPGSVPLQYDSAVVTATVASTSGDTTEQIVRFELETQDQRFTMFGDTSVTLMPYDSLTFSAVMDPMYNLGAHELWVSAHDGLDYQDIDGAQNPLGFSVYQPWGIDSVHVSSVFLSNAVGDSIKREHTPESQVYVRVAFDHDEDDGQKVVLPNFRVRLYDSYGTSYWNVNPADDTLSFAQDTVWLSPIFTLPTDVSRYEVQVLSQGENLSTLATVRYPYTVTVANPQAEQTTTVIDTVAAFDGHKDRVEAASGGMSGNQFTFEGKVYLNALSTGAIISNWHNEHNNPVFELGLTPSKIYCFISGTADVAEYPVSLELDRWYHIVATYNGSAGIQLFLDGNLVSTKPGNCGSTWQADYPWYIGGSDDNMYYYNRAVINGYVDEVRVWNRTRTQSQINATKDVTLSTEYYATADSGLIGYWPFNDDLTDVSTHQRGGTPSAEAVLTTVTTVMDDTTTACADCDTVLIYADAADVVVQDGNYGYQTSWSYHHDLATGVVESVDATVVQIGVSQFDGPAWGDIRRYALPFDTSVLPDTVEIVAATLQMHVVDYRNSQGQSHFLGVTRGTYDLPVTAGDYSHMGAISNPIEGAERLYFAPTDFALHLDSTVVIELDSAGRSWIDLSSMTTLALRQGDDILDMTVNEYAGVWGRGSYVQVATADHVDVAKRPVLQVVYRAASNDTVMVPSEPDIAHHATLTDDLVSFWEMNETSGTRYDAHGSNDLADNNTVTSLAGIQDVAADFTASNSEYLSIQPGTEYGLDLASSFTISAWLHPKSWETKTKFPVVYKDDGQPNRSYMVCIRKLSSGNKAQVVISADGTNNTTSQVYLDIGAISSNAWYHFVWVYDMSIGSVRVYKDGVLTDSLGGLPTTINTSAAVFRVGAWENGNAPYANGAVDQLGMWSRMLSSSEITDLYADGSGLPYDANLLAKQSAGDDEVISLLPTEYNLHQNYPNPFNPMTTIAFDLPHDTHVKIVVYNLLGQEVARLVDERHNAGYHHVQWDARNVASGMYFYRISTESFHKVKKMLLIR